MGVKPTFGKCDIPDGSKVQVPKFPECEGKIKSPMCCGDDMRCNV